jgi:hypothetical protein
MGVLAGIVAALKQIGEVFKNKQPGSSDFDESKTEAPENNVDLPAGNSSIQIPPTATNLILPESPASSNQDTSNAERSATTSEESMVNTSESFTPAQEDNAVVTTNENADTTSSPVTTTGTADTAANTTDNTGNNKNEDKEGFWDKNKKWIKPVAIGVGGLALIAIGFKMMGNNNHHNKSSPKPQNLSGVRNKRNPKNKKAKSKPNHQPKKVVALL